MSFYHGAARQIIGWGVIELVMINPPRGVRKVYPKTLLANRLGARSLAINCTHRRGRQRCAGVPRSLEKEPP